MVKFRNIIGSIAAIVFITAGLLIAFVQWFNWDRYSDDIAVWVGSLTNQEIAIDGPVEVDLLATPRATITEISARDHELSLIHI